MMSVRAAAAIEPVGDVTAVLGEGPYWVPEDDCLLWVDIESGHLHRTYFPSQETVTDSLPAVSAAFPVVGGGILTVGGAALTLLFPAERGGQWSTRLIAEAPARDDLRFNDAGVDPAALAENFGDELLRGEKDERDKFIALLSLLAAYERKLAKLKVLPPSALVRDRT